MSENMKQWDRFQKKWQFVTINSKPMFVMPTVGTTIFAYFTDPKMNTGDAVNFLKSVTIVFSEE